jgi:sulfur carrier protein ThiS
MSATLRCLGMLKSYIGGQNEISIPAGQSIREAMVTINMPPEIAALVLVNDEQQAKDYIVNDGDTIKLMAVIGGG